jgi:cytochrome c peroxidase
MAAEERGWHMLGECQGYEHGRERRVRMNRRGIVLRLMGAGLLAALLLSRGGAYAQEGAAIPRGDHGAAKMDYQMQELAKLMGKPNPAEVPAGLDPEVWEAFIPKDNALTPERVALGQKLYFDTRLSRDGTVACATCHDVTRGFTDQLRVSEGIGGQLGKRNAPVVLNTALLQTLFLDGRSPTLDHQAKMPIVNPIEMGMPDGGAAVKAIGSDPAYRDAFQSA